MTADELRKITTDALNTLALRVRLSGEPTFRDLVARLRVTALDHGVIVIEAGPA